MSTEATSSRKDKKAQRDAERHKKGKKRKTADFEEHEAAAPIEADVDDGENDALEAQSTSKKEKFTKRRNRDGQVLGDQGVASNALDEAATTPKKSKLKRTADDNDEAKTGEEARAESKPQKKRKKNDGEPAETTANGEAQEGAAEGKVSKSRFIVFVGNLPYSSTDAALQAHFKKLAPFTLRHRTDPKTKKSKGFAFLEFENYDRMKTCLQLYHHSTFDAESKEYGGSGKSTAKSTRKINVELTAGGGGTASGRKEKIKAKNTRLDEQRKRRIEAERKQQERKEKKSGGPKPAKNPTETEQQPEEIPEESHSGMHPSRLARLNV